VRRKVPAPKPAKNQERKQQPDARSDLSQPEHEIERTGQISPDVVEANAADLMVAQATSHTQSDAQQERQAGGAKSSGTEEPAWACTQRETGPEPWQDCLLGQCPTSKVSGEPEYPPTIEEMKASTKERC